jgi:hypoxanthine phosphoribosyltransferase
MSDLHVSWDDYHRNIEQLAVKVHASGWEFDQIVCIARGGLRIGDVFSRIFKLPLAILFTQSYVEDHGTVRGEIAISQHIATTAKRLGPRVLLVDDLVDSGVTLDAVHTHLRNAHPHIREMKTAVIWWKAVSRFKPDYHLLYLADNPWIHQPFEPYDSMSIAELLKRQP